jgi:hypothetical protein
MKNYLLDIRRLKVSSLRRLDMLDNKHPVTERTILCIMSMVDGRMLTGIYQSNGQRHFGFLH